MSSPGPQESQESQEPQEPEEDVYYRRHDDDIDEDVVISNGLSLLHTDYALENTESYTVGGLHPVHIGDYLGHGRYHVLHKLGYGGYSTVWLCRDMAYLPSFYVAVKILSADSLLDDCPELLLDRLRMTGLRNRHLPFSRYICFHINHFIFRGPNGIHQCFVYPLLGPKVSLGVFFGAPNLDQILRDICRNITEAVAFIHAGAVCHGGRLILFPLSPAVQV